MSGLQVQIQNRSSCEFVEASLLEGMAPEDLLLVEREWLSDRSIVVQELLRAGVERTKWPQSLHWNWSKKAPQLRLLESTGFSVVCEKKWQGVMLTKMASHVAHLDTDRGKPLVYIDFLEVAPWNWVIPDIGYSGRYRMVGSTLLWRAVKQSVEEGFHGRVGLHALRQSEPFYEKGCSISP